MTTAPVASLGGRGWAGYAEEVLAHGGLTCDRTSPADLDDHQVLLAPSTTDLTTADAHLLSAWVEAGGVLVVLGDPGALADLAGVRVTGVVDDGHVRFDAGPWPRLPDVALHAVGGVRTEPVRATPLASWVGVDGTAATLREVGAGAVLLLAVDVCQSIVRIRQGWPVTSDGVPAADGTAPVDDAILKCEDGLVLDYETDRDMPPGASWPAAFEHVNPPAAPAPMFHRPHADIWAGLVLDALTWAAERTQRPSARLDYWPHGTHAVAHMSHDSDSNTDASAQIALDAFRAAGVQVTWCMQHPGGYAPATYDAIKAAGHEIALHYNAMGDTEHDEWGEEHLRAQHAWLLREAGVDALVSNKNHYTRWEGWDEFYLWCERLGIGIDQSRGPSKQGVVGFPFGTCQLAFPMAADGRSIDVLTLPLHTQDLWWTAVELDRDVILDQAEAEHGVAHFLFHGRNMQRHTEVVDAVLATSKAASDRGMPWWTSEQLDAWERRRRGVRLSVDGEGDRWCVRALADLPVAGASMLLTLPGVGSAADLRVAEGDGVLGDVVRRDRRYVELTADLPTGDTEMSLVRAT